MTPDEIKEKIRQAEESVSEMQDESLRKVAFETILSQLLGSGSVSSSAKPSPAKKEIKKKRPTVQRSDKSKPVQDKVSTLELNMDQLKQLKEFYDDHAPDGTESVVFTLAYFIHENLSQKKFHAADIHVLYQNLLSLKPTTRPPAMSIDEIKRAVRWLVAPSRRKQWIKDAGDGLYEISPQGMLRMTYETKEAKK
jgi:hypothetical protein